MLTSKLSLTLVLYSTLALVLATTSQASIDVNRRHGSLNRLIKKRSPFIERADPLIPVIGGGADPAPAEPNNPPASNAPPGNVPTTTTDQANPPAETDAGASATDRTTVSGSSSAASSTSSGASSSSTSSRSTTVSVPAVVAHTPAMVTTTKSRSVSAILVTSTAAGAASATSTGQPSSNSSRSTTVTVLIVIAACIAGVALIWTIIRKWKFRPSSQFETRMQPIDWQPTISPAAGMANHRRNISGTSSFHSAGHENMAGRGVSPTGYGEPDLSATVVPGIPDHDFTAGPAQLAPIGGYADLARGPSPQPQMQQLTGGPSMHMPHYDQYHHGHPTHHTGYSEDAYDYNGGAR